MAIALLPSLFCLPFFMSVNYRSKFWVFTINNPETDPVVLLEGTYEYLVYQIEEVGTVHVQGYVVFSVQKRRASVSGLLPNAHIEPRKGTHLEAKAYCMKDESRVAGPYEFGDDTNFIANVQGKRSDLTAVKNLLDSGAPMTQIAEEHFGDYLRYRQSFYAYLLLKSVKRNFVTECQVYWGTTGLGKSRRALWIATQRGAFYSKMKSDWWDGYNGETTVIINDFYGWIPYDELLRLLDRYPHQVQVKGGYMNFNSPLVIITSNKHPNQWYNAERCPFEPLNRRLTLVSQMINPWDETMG